MLEFLCVVILLWIFWRPLLVMAGFALAFLVPLLVALVTLYVSGSAIGAVVAAGAALVVVCSLLGDVADIVERW